MRWLRDQLKELAGKNRRDWEAFLVFDNGRKRRQLKKRLRELREEMARMGPINKEVKS